MARKIIIRVARHAGVARLRVEQAVDGRAVHDQTDPDAGADRSIGHTTWVLALVDHGAVLGESGRVHVRVEFDGHAEDVQSADDVRVPPQFFWRLRDVAIRL